VTEPRVMTRVFVSTLTLCSTALVASILWPRPLLSHGSVTTTVLFDREIVRILDRHCVMCHMERGPAFALETYEQTWVQGKKIRASILARHMPPWGAVSGYGQFVNGNSLTLRETQFLVSWVEGLGPRNAGTVFANVVDAGVRPAAVRAQPHVGHWQAGEPDLTRELPANTIAAGQTNEVRRTTVDPGLTADRQIRAVEFQPGDRRVVRAAFFSVQETGQWIGSWTPWHGMMELPEGSAYRLRAGSRIVAEIHYRGTSEPVDDRGTLGLYFVDRPPRFSVSDLVLEAKPNGTKRLRAETRLTADTYAVALRPELADGLTSIEVSARRADGGTEILLFVKDPPADWPTPYIFSKPVFLSRGTTLAVTAYYEAAPPPGGMRLRVNRY
jgi:hypothetical protein